MKTHLIKCEASLINDLEWIVDCDVWDNFKIKIWKKKVCNQNTTIKWMHAWKGKFHSALSTASACKLSITFLDTERKYFCTKVIRHVVCRDNSSWICFKPQMDFRFLY